MVVEKSVSNKKCEKRAGLGRDGAAPPPPLFPSRARLIFALLVYVPTILSESLAQATV